MDTPWQGHAGQMSTVGGSCPGCTTSSTSSQPAVFRYLQAQPGHLYLLEALNNSCKSPITYMPHCSEKGILCKAFSLLLQAGSAWHSGCTEETAHHQSSQINRSRGSGLAGSLSGSHRCKQFQCSRLGLICWAVIGLRFVICPTRAACGWLAQ